MDLRFSPEQELLRRSIREFAEAEIRPHVMEWDEAQHFPAELRPKLAALGLMGIQISEEFGGAEMSAIDYCLCIEELARVEPSICLSVGAHKGLRKATLAAMPPRVHHRRSPTALHTACWRAGSGRAG